MNNILKISLLLSALFLLYNCTDYDVVKDSDKDKEEELAKLGYAHPEGVFILNSGVKMFENSSLTYIAPDGTVETDVYKKVNGTDLGNDAVDMYMYNNKLYILCSDYTQLEGKPSDGALIIADAVTLKKEKSYKLNDFTFDLPEGMRPEDKAEIISLSNIAVLDENNIFIKDSQGLFRFNPTTNKLTLVKGTYHIANQGGNLESKTSSKSMAVVNDKLYLATGGFWSDAGIVEIVKNKDEVNRELSFESANLSSGIVAGEDGNVWVSTYNRANKNKNYVYNVSAESMTILDSKNVRADFAPGYNNTSGISAAGDAFYFSGQTTQLQRFSFESAKAELLVDVKTDEPKAIYLNTNMVVNPSNNYVYVATSEENMDNQHTQNNLLIYDCSGDKAVLKQNIKNQTSFVSGIFPLHKFYKKN